MCKRGIYMTIWIVSVLTAVCFCIGFTGLLPKRLNIGCYIALGAFFLIVPNLLGPVMGQSITVLYLLTAFSIIFAGSHKDIAYLLWSALGYLIVVFVNHLFTIPLSLMGITIAHISQDYPVTFLLLQTFTTILIIFAVRRFLLKRIMRYLPDFPVRVKLLLLAEILAGISILTAGFAIGEKMGYPPDLLAYNGILSALMILLTIMLFYFLFRLMRNNYELSVRQQEYALMDDYFKRMEGFYDEVRSFRHDYKNILTTMRGYIESDSLPELREYFFRKILPSEKGLNNDYFILGALKNMKVIEIKSILYTKLLHAISSGCHIQLTITDEISHIPTDLLALSRIFGILLDNCTEAALETQDKQLSVGAADSGKYIVFCFQNNTPPINGFEKLSRPGYSTKPGHEGLGMNNIQNLVHSTSRLSYWSIYDSGIFFQELSISKEVNGNAFRIHM